MQSCCKELPKIQSGLNTKPNGLFSLCNILKELVKSLKFFQPQPFNRVISKKLVFAFHIVLVKLHLLYTMFNMIGGLILDSHVFKR
ncbi:hypothetical protein Hanom_Chr10g00890651 [Helianthus anomalus]